MFRDFPTSIKRLWYSLYNLLSYNCFLKELAAIGKILVFIGTVILFIYAMFYPSAIIIFILFIFFISTLALVEL